MLSSEKWLRLSKQSIDAIVLEKVYIEGELRQRHMVTTSKKTHSYHSLIKNSSDIIALINGEGIVTYVSPSITPITGYTAEEIVGCYVIFLVHPDDLDTVQQMLGEIGQSPGESLLAEYRLRCKDGSWRWFEGSGTNLLDVPGVEAIVGNFRDISERKLAPHSHWSEMSESEHFVQFYESDVFLLDSLSGFIGTGLSAGDACVVIATKAHRERLEERLKADGLNPVAAQVQKLTKLINDLLDLSKMQTGQLVYREERFDLDALVQEIVENIQGTTQTHHVLLEGQTLAEAFGDQDRIGQVLINLLNNAIKYSPQADRVMVRVTKDQNKALVSVQDFGIGIAKDHQQEIFERFYQVTDAAEKTYPGLGIGLYISSEIVKRHGGQMWVESEKDEGATFHVTLPLYQEEKRQASLSHGDVRVMC